MNLDSILSVLGELEPDKKAALETALKAEADKASLDAQAATEAAIKKAVAEEVKGLKSKRDEIFGKLEAFKGLGSPKEIQERLKKSDELQQRMEAAERAAQAKEQGSDPEKVEELAQAQAAKLNEQFVKKHREQQQPKLEEAQGEIGRWKQAAEDLETRLSALAQKHEIYRVFGQDVDADRWRQLEVELAPQVAVHKPETLGEDDPWWAINTDRQSYRVAVVDPEDGKSPQMSAQGPKTLEILHEEMLADPKYSYLWRQAGSGSGFEATPAAPPPPTSGDPFSTNAEQDVHAALFGAS